MDFIMDHSSLFLSIGVIMLLALIGYYADKSESKKKTKDKSSKPSTGKDEVLTTNEVTPNEVKNDIMDSFSQLPQGIPDMSTSDNGVWGNNVSFEEPVKENPEIVEDLTPEINANENTNNGYFDISQDIPVINNSADQIDLDEPIIPNFDVPSSGQVVEPSFEQQNVDAPVVSEPVTNVPVDEGILKNVPVENVITDAFDSTSFENTGMSLDDLEKKNFEKIVNNMKSNSSNDYNDYDDSGVDEFISGSEGVSEETMEQPVVENVQPTIEEPIESSIVEPTIEQPIDTVESNSDDFSYNTENNSTGVQDNVPELNEDSVVSTSFDSNNNDIWKF